MREISVAVTTLPNGDLVMQRKDEGAPRSPGLLCLIGGAVEKGETPEEAMLREAEEETTLNIAGISFRPIISRRFYIPDDATETDVLANVYEMAIASVDFEFKEGRKEPEAYKLKELLKRSDVDPTVKEVLRGVKHYIS